MTTPDTISHEQAEAAEATGAAEASGASDVAEYTTVTLAKALLARPSLTPHDAGCMDLILEVLAPLGFKAQFIDRGETRNLWITHGAGSPCVVFAGHTDVVPVGARDQWTFDPFTPTEHEGKLYARGAADMKSSVAAMVIACRDFVRRQPDHAGTVALLITSDEEGKGDDGTRFACEVLKAQGVAMDYCIVGEPSSHAQLGDTIKNGRRGSLHGYLTVYGKQGHVAYPQRASNPIHLASKAISSLVATEWDQGNNYFPPTSFQITNMRSGTGADNVIPADAFYQFNFRFCPESSVESLQARVHEALQRAGLTAVSGAASTASTAASDTQTGPSGAGVTGAQAAPGADSDTQAAGSTVTPSEGSYTLDWWLSGEPFMTPQGRLVSSLSSAIKAATGLQAECSTTGGTSDGRFIAKICPEVVEFGPVNATIHQVNEHIRLADLEPLKTIYHDTLAALLAA